MRTKEVPNLGNVRGITRSWEQVVLLADCRACLKPEIGGASQIRRRTTKQAKTVHNITNSFSRHSSNPVGTDDVTRIVIISVRLFYLAVVLCRLDEAKGNYVFSLQIHELNRNPCEGKTIGV